MSCFWSAFKKVKDFGTSVYKSLKNVGNWCLNQGFHVYGSFIDVKVIFRILLSFGYTVVYPSMDLITDILVVMVLFMMETLARRYSLSSVESVEGKVFAEPLKKFSNHYLSLAAILILTNTILSVFVSTIRKVSEEWKKSRSLWSLRKLITELPVITGFCHLPSLTKSIIWIRQLELKLEKEEDKQSENARKLRGLLRKSNSKILRWKVECTITEFFFEAAPSMILLLLVYLSFGGLPKAILYSLLTSCLTSFLTSGKIFLAQKNTLPPILSHQILVALPVGFITTAKLLSVGLLIELIALLLDVNAQLIFIVCYIVHCVLLVST